MSLLLEAQSTPELLIIEPGFMLVVLMDDLGWYITSHLKGQMLVQNPHGFVSRQNITPELIQYCTTTCIPIPINLVFWQNFPTNTQVWNRI